MLIVLLLLLSEVKPNISFEPRIVGGEPGTKDRYPYFVSLLDKSGVAVCGGSLIASDIVLSAAHCKDVVARAQVGRFNTEDSSDSFDELSIISQYVHPNYTKSKKRFDFMMLKLNGTSNRQVARINREAVLPRVGETVTAMGFGLTNPYDLSSRSGVLLHVNQYIVNNSICASSLRVPVNPDMLCAYRAEKDTCLGDSGGPLIVVGNTSASDFQVGITSWGIGCAMGYPSVYARASYEFDWISMTMCTVSSVPPSGYGCLSWQVPTDPNITTATSSSPSPFPSLLQNNITHSDEYRNLSISPTVAILQRTSAPYGLQNKPTSVPTVPFPQPSPTSHSTTVIKDRNTSSPALQALSIPSLGKSSRPMVPTPTLLIATSILLRWIFAK